MASPSLAKTTSNKYVSTAAVSRAEKLFITELFGICEMDVERTNKCCLAILWTSVSFGRKAAPWLCLTKIVYIAGMIDWRNWAYFEFISVSRTCIQYSNWTLLLRPEFPPPDRLQFAIAAENRQSEGEDGCYREKFRSFVPWAEPDPKTAFFAFFGYHSTILHTAYRKQFYPKPMVPMESQDSEGVPFASLKSLWPGIWQI